MRGRNTHLVARALTAGLFVAIVVTVLLGACRPVFAAQEPKGRVRAAVVGAEPFVVRQDGGFEGVSVEIFRAIAAESNLEVELVPVATVPLALDAVARREVDVAVGPVSITAERAERTRFTQPYFQSSLGILAPRSASWLARLSGFLSRAFFAGLAILLVVLMGVGTLIWLVERRKNPEHFPPRPGPGIANGVWFALVTMTTVGYGDRVPMTPAGRVVAGVWMVIALISASSLTAGIATAITVAQLSPPRVTSVEQLADQRVAVVGGSPAVPFARRARARLVLVDDFEHGVARLRAGEVDAFVFDRPSLRYYLQKNPELDLVVSEASYLPQGYGFAVMDAELQHTLNVALLRVMEGGAARRITTNWLGPDVDDER